MSVYIYQNDALDLLAKVEGDAWKFLQERRPESPQGFYAWLNAWRRLEEEGYAGECPVGLYVEGNDGCIYGEGGYARYRVCRDGELVLWRSSTNQDHARMAEEQGFLVT